MNSPDWDSEAEVEMWCAEQRLVAAEYLSRQPVRFGDLGHWPAWHVAPYVAIWAVESVATPGWVGWWVISGDLPTDYTSRSGANDPRGALALFARRWEEASKQMERGESHSDTSVDSAAAAPELGKLLMARSRILTTWASDSSLWKE